MSDSLNAGGVNASIPLQAGRGVVQNPLAASPGEFANTLNSFNQLKLFPQRQQQLELQNQGLDLANKQAALNQQMQRYSYFQGLMTPLLVDPKTGKATTGVDVKDIQRGLATVVGDGVASTQDAVRLLSTLPDGGADPAANRTWVLQHYAAFSSAQGQLQQQMAALNPNVATRDNGQSIQTGQVTSPLFPGGGTFTPQSETPVYPPRSQLIGQVQWQDKNGVTHYGTQAEYAAARGLGNALGPAMPVQGAPQTGAQPPAPGQPAFPPGYTGRLPQQPQSAAGDTEGPAPTTVQVQQASGDQYLRDRQIAGTLGQRIFPLKQQIDLLSDTDTGPGSETANWYRSALISAANQGLLPKSITPDNIQQAKFDELKKYMAQYITGQPFAAGSDARMAEMVSGSPNATLSTLANKDVAKVLIGMERFRSAPYLAFQMEHKGDGDAAAGDYAKFAADFSKNYDPRAFAVDLMGGWNSPKVKEMFTKMSGDEQKKFIASLKMAYSIPGLLH